MNLPEYTAEQKNYYEMILGKFSKSESKSFDFMVKLNTDETFAKKFYGKVFGKKSMLEEAEFLQKAAELYEKKYRSILNTGDLLELVKDNRHLIDRWFECGLRTLVRKF